MFVRGGFRPSSCNRQNAQPARFVKHQLNTAFVSSTFSRRTFSAAPAAPSEEIQEKFKQYKELLAKRQAENEGVTAKIGQPINNSPDAEAAHSLYWAAYNSKGVNTVEADIKKIRDYISQNSDFSTYLTRGSLPNEFVSVQGDNVPAKGRVVMTPPTLKDQNVTIAVVPSSKTPKSLVDDLVAAVKPTDATSKALYSLAENNRLTALPDVFAYFTQQAARQKAKAAAATTTTTAAAAATGSIDAVLTVPEPWSDAEIDKLLKQFFQENPGYAGATPNLTVKVDPSIMGGFKLKIADRFIDASDRKEYERSKKAEEILVDSADQRRQEAAQFLAEQYYPGPYANDNEYLEAMEDKYGDGLIESIRSLPAEKFQEEIKAGPKSSLISAALEAAQPTDKQKAMAKTFFHFKENALPNPTVDEVVNDFRKLRALAL